MIHKSGLKQIGFIDFTKEIPDPKKFDQYVPIKPLHGQKSQVQNGGLVKS